MIAKLRARHRMMFTGLALAVSPLLAAAFLWRTEPASQVFPVHNVPDDAPRLTLTPAGDSGLELALHAQGVVARLTQPLRKPDVLAYWSAQDATGVSLPDHVFLLGPVSARHDNFFPRQLWPEAANDGDGFLILYSLGHQELVSSTVIPALGFADAHDSDLEGEPSTHNGAALSSKAGDEAGGAS